MIRFYETVGILKPKRNINGYRTYNVQDVTLIQQVVLLNKAGLALKDIALLRDCLQDKPQDFCTTLKDKLELTRSEIDLQINSLEKSKKLLDKILLS